MAWNPAAGTAALRARLGPGGALDALIELLSGDRHGEELVWSDMRAVLLDVGNGHAVRLMSDGTGARLAYWPRVWAARSMAYLQNMDAVEPLVGGIKDEHWRVRMTCVQSLGRLGASGLTSELVGALNDEHRRVREAAVVALGRVGDESALGSLYQRLGEDSGNQQLTRAIRRIEERSHD